MCALTPEDGSRAAGQDAQQVQSALLNILDDLTAQQSSNRNVHCAVLNILEDSEADKQNLQATQRAVLNILEDFDLEKSKVASINRELQTEAQERQRAQEEIQQLNLRLEQRVTERTAELVASNHELEAFSYSVSHDLRAPLRAIDGFSQALLEDCSEGLPDEGKNDLQRIRAASQKMDRLIDGILVLSRTTRVEMRIAPVSLTNIARDIASELQKANPQRQVEIVIQPDLSVIADSILLHAVMQNLLGNAWKFTSKHTHARIEVGKNESEQGVTFFVRDDGAGFDMAYAAKLFGAFQRLHTPAEFEGTGIGLATVQRIIRRHGGRIWAEGAVEAGATFYFTLPGNTR